MSGIAGEISFIYDLSFRRDEFKRMEKSIMHRGPDQYGEYISTNAVLMSTRLVNSGYNDGLQPMTAYKNEVEYIIVCDGMLFNSTEIYHDLKKAGYSFKGRTDTEIILNAFIEYGKDCLEMFNGVFAFAIWNKKKQELFIARDRFGIKPLFYSNINNNLIFGSEIKALLANNEISPSINLDSIKEIMLLGPGRTLGYGVFENISELKPACYGIFNTDGFKTEQYWKLTAKENNDNFEQTVEKVRSLVLDSIHRQLTGDYPVYTMLSGGLDSSLISSVAAKYFKESKYELNTFTVNYTDNEKYFKKSDFQPNSDTEFTDIMNKYLNVKNHFIEIDTPQLFNAIYTSVDARDLPGMADIDSSLILFCKEIKNHTKTVLSGECSDEIFGGYRWYREEEMRNIQGFPWTKSPSYRLSFVNNGLIKSNEAEEYSFKKYKATVDNTSFLESDNAVDKRVREMMNLNLEWFMMTLVDRSDRMSAYNGLDVRVPYCDYRIVEYLYNVPWKFKYYKNYEKGLLREAMKDFLPDEILWRKKSPYPKTHNPNYMNLVSKEMRNLLENSNAKIFKFVNKNAIEKLLTEFSSEPFYGQLMTTPQTIAYFLQINYWLEKYNIKINL